METLVEENGNPNSGDPLANSEEVGTVTSVGDQDSYSQDSTTYVSSLNKFSDSHA